MGSEIELSQVKLLFGNFGFWKRAFIAWHVLLGYTINFEKSAAQMEKGQE